MPRRPHTAIFSVILTREVVQHELAAGQHRCALTPAANMSNAETEVSDMDFAVFGCEKHRAVHQHDSALPT